jgi:hypothetical protein
METNTTKLLEFEEFKKAYGDTEIPNCKYHDVLPTLKCGEDVI